MDICYFYITEHVENGTLMMEHCPMEDMLADYVTKPLQGSLFIKLWNFIIRADYTNGDWLPCRSV